MSADLHLPSIVDRSAFGAVVPAIVADTHDDAAERFLEFFAAAIRNPNTRAAYMNAVADFLAFAPLAALGSLAEVRSIHVSAYIEHVAARFAPQTVKQRLAALRGLFDWLARHGVLEVNPAAPVRGPAYSQARGKTPILAAAEAKRLIESIETDALVGLRDRALIATMVYSFARVGRGGDGYRGPGPDGRPLLAAALGKRRQGARDARSSPAARAPGRLPGAAWTARAEGAAVRRDGRAHRQARI